MNYKISALALCACLVAGCKTHRNTSTEFVLEIDDPLSLSSAILSHDHARMLSLLQSGYPVEGRSEQVNEPAYWSISSGEEKALSVLIEHGLDVNYDWGEEGGNLLTNAAQFGNLEIVRILIEEGASVERNPSVGRSPLYASMIYGHEHIEEYLLSKGAKLNAWDQEAFERLGINPNKDRTSRHRSTHVTRPEIRESSDKLTP
jgi:ankyrin repeat protein